MLKYKDKIEYYFKKYNHKQSKVNIITQTIIIT